MTPRAFKPDYEIADTSYMPGLSGLGGWNGDCRYLRASSSAFWVLSLVCRAWRYSLVARSRCPVRSKILPNWMWLQTSVQRGSPSRLSGLGEAGAADRGGWCG